MFALPRIPAGLLLASAIPCAPALALPSPVQAARLGASDLAPRVDPPAIITSRDYVKASNTGTWDQFGGHIALLRDTLAIGATGESSSASGSNGDQSDDSFQYAGAVYVYGRSAGAWAQQTYLKAEHPGSIDGFGRCVALSGDRLLVTAAGEGSSATGVNGDQTDNSEYGSGAGYVYLRRGDAWVLEAYLKASNSQNNDQFGWRADLDGDTAVISAWLEDGSSTGIDGDQHTEEAEEAGAVYVFRRRGTTWTQEAYIKASNTGAGDRFGYELDLCGDRLAVSAVYEDSASTGIGGDQNNDDAYNAGAVYVFEREGTTWRQDAYIKPDIMDVWDLFGSAVVLEGDTLIVGASGEDSASPGVDADPLDNSQQAAGAVYVFDHRNGAWGQTAYLKPSNPEEGDRFGQEIAFANEVLVVGAGYEDGSATGIGGDATDNGAEDAGAAYVFVRDGTRWTYHSYLKASNTGEDDRFGARLAIDGDELVVGAWNEGSGSVGVNGDGGNDSTPHSGAAYTFDLDLVVGEPYCTSVANTTGLAGRIYARGTPDVGNNDMVVHASGVPVDRPGIFFYGQTQVQVTFGNGYRCIGSPHLLNPPVFTDAAGHAERRLDFTTDPLLSDITPTLPSQWNFQFWFRDADSSNTTDALSVDFFD